MNRVDTAIQQANDAVDRVIAHTPGPWSVQGDRDSGMQELHIVQDAVVDAEIAVVYPMLGYAKADIANARLIAAAPEMLAILELVEQVIEGPTLLAKVQAVIQKARGNQ